MVGLKKRICVIDGQGGGIGATVIKYIVKGRIKRMNLVDHRIWFEE